jgi:hypothetical protein
MRMLEVLNKAIYDFNGLLELQQAKRRPGICEDIKAGKLRASKAGRHTIFFVDDVARWLEALRQDSHLLTDPSQGGRSRKPKLKTKAQTENERFGRDAATDSPLP